MTEAETTRIALEDIQPLCLEILTGMGFNAAHANTIAETLYRCQLDDCQSHGLFRLLMCVQTLKAGRVDPLAEPTVTESGQALIRVDASEGMSLLAYEVALPILVSKARQYGIAALAINRCFHFSALWPEVERLAEHHLAAIAMCPSQAWVAPAGGARGVLGTNPLAFSWPRMSGTPFTFDFATSGVARGEIELHRRAGKPLPEGLAVDKDGNPTTDPEAAMQGAMLTFGGYKGSALSIMIELLGGPMIDDLISLESKEFGAGKGGAPYHGEIIIALDPNRLSGGRAEDNDARAERLFAAITDQGARLPSERRYAARKRNLERGYVEITTKLYNDILALKA